MGPGEHFPAVKKTRREHFRAGNTPAAGTTPAADNSQGTPAVLGVPGGVPGVITQEHRATWPFDLKK